ncbi:carbohydrate ABC transporter permease [Paenibacillus tepidiphilus]|uniref:carbohydrate ABC transporter permease n=1 Tax=Paenibacillus tepidiphilus TaxID=2608683 RepID=UPI00123A8F7E|nr:sugar ABC transporter permease [Paenibacillus tepidiphilus]
MEKVDRNSRLFWRGRDKPSEGAGSGSGRLLGRLDKLSDTSTAYLYLLPTLVLIVLVVVVPMLYALFISFTKVAFTQGNMTYEFVGFGNYIQLLRDARFPQVMTNTMFFTVVKVILTLSIAFGISLTIYFGVWGAAFFKRLFLIPWALSNVVNSLMWQWMYSGDYGIFNELLLRLGFIDQYQMWLVNVHTAMPAVLFADIWKSVPYVALLLLAAMQSIPRELHEASRVDGGGSITAFYHIILPHIKPVITVLLVIETMWTLRVFDLIWLLTKGGPQDGTMTLNVFAYEQAFRNFNIGYGAAISYCITLLTLVFTLLYMKTLKVEN